VTATLYTGWMKYQGILKGKDHCTIDLLFDWFGISCVTTDNFSFLFAKQTNPNQSNRRSMVQWYFPLLCSLEITSMSLVENAVLTSFVLLGIKRYYLRDCFFKDFSLSDKTSFYLRAKRPQRLFIRENIQYWFQMFICLSF
jgi:hypothetical protein